MRVTDDDYKNIIEFCKEKRMTNSISKLIGEGTGYTGNLLARMERDGFLKVEIIPFKGQTRKLYKATDSAYELLKKRIEYKLKRIKDREEANRVQARERAASKAERRIMQAKVLQAMTDEFIKPEVLAKRFNKTILQIGRILTGMQSAGLIERDIIKTESDRERVVYRKKKKEKGVTKVCFNTTEMREKLKQLHTLNTQEYSNARRKYSVSGSTLNELG